MRAPAGDGRAADFGVDDGLAEEALDRRFEAEGFFDEVGDELGLRAEPLHDLRVMDEEHHAGGDEVRRGFVPGDEDLLEDAEHLGHIERARLFAFEADMGVEEVGEDIVAGVGAALFETLGEVVLEFDDGLRALDFAFAGEEAAEGCDGVIGPALEAVHIGAVDAEGIGDDGEGKRHGELADELDFAVVDEAVDEVVGDGGDGGFEAGDAPCGEGLIDERAVAEWAGGSWVRRVFTGIQPWRMMARTSSSGTGRRPGPDLEEKISGWRRTWRTSSKRETMKKPAPGTW